MNYYILSPLINCVASLLLGGVVYLKNPRNQINWSFSLFAFAVGLWSLCYYFWQISTTSSDALFWSRALMAFAIFIPAFYLHFVFSFLGILKNKKRLLILTYAIFFIFFLTDIFTPQFVDSVSQALYFPFWPKPGIIFNIFLAVWIFYVIYSTYLLYKRYKVVGRQKKEQIKFILFGMIIGFAGGSTNYFLWYGIPITPVGNIFVSIYVAMTAYAIIKHRFLDIRLIIARTIAYVLLIIIIGLFYSLSLLLIGSTIFSLSFSFSQLLYYGIITLLVAFTFQPMRRAIESLTDKVFYKDLYNPHDLLRDLSFIMNSTIKLDALTLNILEKVILDMKVTRGVFVLFSEKDEQVIEYIEQRGFDSIPSFTATDVHAFFAERKLTVLDDLEEGQIKELMRKLNITVVLQLAVNEKRIGVLLLGEKASGDVYSEQDINVFEILAPQLSIAIQNSREYEEIKRFNITLSEEIDKATKELLVANEKLKQLDKLKDEFVSLASHELRTPMTAIKSYLWMAISGRGGPISEKQKYYLGRAYKSTERLIKLVNDMLNVSRIESGRITLTLLEANLEQVIDDVILELTPRAQELGINLSFAKQGILPHVLADADKIKEVIINLVGNSLKFTPKGGSITVLCRQKDNNTVETSIADTGAGLDAEDTQKLFQKFGIVGDNFLKKQNAQGTGLGLYISKSIIELHGGTIQAKSEGLGKGSTFSFTLKQYTNISN